jgi:hypothetical protein
MTWTPWSCCYEGGGPLSVGDCSGEETRWAFSPAREMNAPAWFKFLVQEHPASVPYVAPKKRYVAIADGTANISPTKS